MLRLRCLPLVARSRSTPAPPAPPPQTARPGTSHQRWTLRAIGYRLLDGEVTGAHRPSQKMTLARPALETCLQRLRIQLSPVFGAQQLQSTLQSVVISVSQHKSLSDLHSSLQLFGYSSHFFFSPVWWPLVILLLPGVVLLSRWMAKLQKPLIGSQASWWKHTFVPGKQRVRAWALAVCVRASNNLGGPFFRHALIALPDSAYCRLQDHCVLKEARVCHVVPGAWNPALGRSIRGR